MMRPDRPHKVRASFKPMLTKDDIKDLDYSHNLLRHILDAEPVSKKVPVWEILLWSLDTLSPILIRDGKYRKPGLFGLFKLATFAIQLIKKINEALKNRNKP